MELPQLADVLQKHGFDTSSLELVLSRDEERIYQITVPAREAVQRWHALRALVDETRHWPVLGMWRRWLDSVPEYRVRVETGSTTAILAESERIDVTRWQQTKAEEHLADVRESADYFGESVEDYLEEVEGEWPEDATPSTTFAIPKNAATRDSVPQLEVALIPTVTGWQAPAYLRFDAGFTSPAVHTAMARHWADKYGAEIIGMLPVLMEMHVKRPPATRDAALALAREQYTYCQDIVIQGTQTIQALAAALLNGTAWFFWWD